MREGAFGPSNNLNTASCWATRCYGLADPPALVRCLRITNGGCLFRFPNPIQKPGKGIGKQVRCETTTHIAEGLDDDVSRVLRCLPSRSDVVLEGSQCDKRTPRPGQVPPPQAGRFIH